VNWISDILGWQVVPSHRDKYVYITVGAVVGGITFGLTGSWYSAIWWDIIAAFSCWAAVKIVAPFTSRFLRP
jgi:hypothetical protein